ncbi:energy-coupling factor transporter ATPase [Apilactobacillus apisilvae]|uniref:Energy-coupling factor transporter ATPase n=1 Tax=Apilactobacillus apisilvae TaxID=2923364 RepID=A0ABY4PJB5_9LACO|nr:energy-coupling factor transporter ATPase [Apilactobacillus apisilvae]UQS85607.1 energy-coupling factor transporter ATPase [Apilactobacillus apisilvae]
MDKKIINVKNLKFKYDNNSNYAINNLSFSVNKGEWLSIIGKNGSGKTTLISLLDGLIQCETGNIFIDGLELNESNLNNIRDKIGIVFQNPNNQFVASTVKEDVAFGLENRQYNYQNMHKTVHDILVEVGMTQYENSNPSRLSGGQQQRVALAGVLAVLPSIIILDESTSMLDPKAKDMLINLVNQFRKKYDLTVISITHDMDEVQYSDRVMLLEKGKLIKYISPLTLFNEISNAEDYGLELPLSEKIRIKLSENGFNLGNNYMNNEEIAKWIIRYHSKM